MPYDPVDISEIQVGDAITAELMAKFKGNDDFLFGKVGGVDSNDIYNGSMEVDADGDLIPDGWEPTYYTGGSGAWVTGAHGAKMWSFTAPSGAGNGGGYLDSDLVPIGHVALSGSGASGTLYLGWAYYATAATIGVEVRVRFYDAGQIFISDTVIMANSTDNQTSMDRYCIAAINQVVPATARFIKVRLVGGTVGPGVAGTVYFDNVTVRPSIPWNFKSLGTFAEQTTTATSFAEVTTMNLDNPYQMFGFESYVSFALQVKHSGGGGPTFARCGINGVYSETCEVPENNPAAWQTVPIIIPYNPIGTASNVVSVQLQRVSPGTAHVKKEQAMILHSLLDPA